MITKGGVVNFLNQLGFVVLVLLLGVQSTSGQERSTAQDDTSAKTKAHGQRTVRVPVRVLNEARRASGHPVLRSKSGRDSVTMSYSPPQPRSIGFPERLNKRPFHPSEESKRMLPDTPPVRRTTLPNFRPDTSRLRKSKPSDGRLLIEGITYGLFSTSRSIPADAHGAVGPDHVCHVVNTAIQCHTKEGSSTFKTDFSEFFDQGDYFFDPKITYDPRLSRYVLVLLNQVDNGTESENKSEVYLAASDDSNPSGTWNFQVFNMASVVEVSGTSTECWFDYPGFALGEEAIYMTGNYYGFESEVQAGEFCDSRLAIFDKALLRGDGSALYYLADPNRNVEWIGGDYDATMIPAQIPGGGPGDDIGTWLAMYSNLHSLSDGYDHWLLTRVDDPLDGPTFETSHVSIGSVDDSGADLPNAPQPEYPETIETNNKRLLDLVWRRGHLWGTTTVNPPPGTGQHREATALFAKIDVRELGRPSLAVAEHLGGEDIEAGAHTYFPSVAVDRDGNAAFGFSLSGPDTYANSYLVTRPSSGPLSPTYLAAKDPYRDPYLRTDSDGENRWGDYSDVEIDPVDGSVWAINQVAADRVTACLSECGAWKVYVANFSSYRLPVELAKFEAHTDVDAVILTWKTASETNNLGFKVQRRLPRRTSWSDLGFVEGSGTRSTPQSYRFVDADLPFGTDSLSYRLKQVDTDGTTSLSEPLVVRRNSPSEIQLLGTFPNPTRSHAIVRFTLPRREKVTLRIYDVLGRRVATPKQGTVEAGRNQFQLDTSELPSGVYFLHLVAGGTTQTRKLTVIE